MDYQAILQKLIAFPTVNDPAKEVRPTRECPQFLHETLSKIGYQSTILEKNGFYSVLATYGKGRPVSS
jgi:succinyl-diaminopimelate desuccinylase